MDLKAKVKAIPSPIYKALAIGFITGILWFITMRVVLYQYEGTHYHANFAVYIDGNRELFEEGTYYAEVASCGSDDGEPITRVHMHDLVPDVVHVHDNTATWGNFFENIGFVLGNNVLYSRAQSYVDGTDGTLSFILNGEKVRDIANRTITSEDRLLISFSSESDPDLDAQYAQIEATAAEFNEKQDPSSCSGSGEAPTFINRLKNVVGL